MRKSFLIILFLLLGLPLLLAQTIPLKPYPPRLVNDFTNTLAPDQVQQLENDLARYADTTSNQLVLLIVPSTGSYAPVDFCTEVGRAWGVGTKEHNNGLIFMIAMEDKKTFIAPGYGLEGNLPDVICKRIIREDFTPYAKQGDFYLGITKSLESIQSAIGGTYAAKHKDAPGLHSLGLIVLILVVFIAFIGISIFNRKRFQSFSGTGASALPFLFLGGLGGGGSSGGGGWGGGSGGGFGDFGGGGFGGGGAGGGW